MRNIIIIKSDLNVEPILNQINQNWRDWDWVASLQKDRIGGDKDPYGFLPLVWAKVKKGENPKDVEATEKTPLFDHFSEVHKFWKKNKIYKTGRAAFFKLEPDGEVGRHIDDGEYYITKDRYHLSLQSRYHYTVGDEEMIVEPGTFFWFNNKLPHSAHNIGDVDRVSLVWDAPHNARNPQHRSGTRGQGFG